MNFNWIHRLKKGDVLRFHGDVLRVVRAVSHYEKLGRWHTNVTLAIRTCSWTGRPYTVYTHHDLIAKGVRRTRAKVSLRSKLDREIERDMHGRIVKNWDGSTSRYSLLGSDRRISCCDVRGIQ